MASDFYLNGRVWMNDFQRIKLANAFDTAVFADVCRWKQKPFRRENAAIMRTESPTFCCCIQQIQLRLSFQNRKL